MTKNFTSPSEAKAFGESLKARGITCQVQEIRAQPAQVEEKADSTAAEAEIAEFAAKGETLGTKALEWAKSSPYWDGDLQHCVICLEADLEDGCTNRATVAQATLFLKRLNAALSRSTKRSVVICPAQPQSWNIVWSEPVVETGHARDAVHADEAWGTSVGSDGWMCD